MRINFKKFFTFFVFLFVFINIIKASVLEDIEDFDNTKNSTNYIFGGGKDTGSNIISELSEKLLPAVVSIKATTVVKRELNKYNNNYYYYTETSNTDSIGSGFIISENGYILTNAHVIENSDDIFVYHNNIEYTAELIGFDTISDIAVLKINSNNKLPFFVLKNDINLKIGEGIIVIGNPYDLGVSVSSGIISALNRNIKGTDYSNLIQTDAAINRGNSGGPVFNLNGDVIGIASVIFSEKGDNIGLGFAININNILDIIERLKVHGYVQRGFIGAKMVEADAEILKILNVNRQFGILVKEIIKDSPADKGGLLPSDIILSFDNKQLRSLNHLNDLIRTSTIDSVGSFLIFRDNNFKTLKIKIDEIPSENYDFSIEKIKNNSIEIFDMYLTSIDKNLIEKFELYDKSRGLLVLDLKEKGWAEFNGVEKGDIILSANQTQLHTKEDFVKVINQIKMKKNKNLLLIIKKNNTKQNILLKLNLGMLNL